MATQQHNFPEIESTLERGLSDMSAYYLENHLRPNPGKTQICSFHLKNREAKRELDVTWDGIKLENYQHPVYLGVTLDRTLSYKAHIQKTRAKVSTRNSLLRQLTNSKWVGSPKYTAYIGTSLVLLHRRICLPSMEQIVPCTAVITKAERTKQANDNRHSLHEHSAAQKRLSSRSSFLDTTEVLGTTQTDARITEWQNQWNSLGNQTTQWMERGITPDKCLTTVHDQPWPVWKTLNRLRVGEGRCKVSMKKWKITTSGACVCGESQTMEHIMRCSQAPQCTGDDLAEPNAAALTCANHWKDVI
ncbi:hypothetical protein SKAU_G00412000 [Synaphobranchus kaupii]|uniref:Uncharacterized protein n=1 Tax=Synaphobranchus kaupii TaxID=118154 RepID=A0A9Q1E7Y2_SYNKA|nr:hypothetical protein SKAU_G00412000 [Synaphobranchus kaupii]